jgi:hypothetical protein
VFNKADYQSKLRVLVAKHVIILSPSEREEEKVSSSAQSGAYAEWPNPPFIEAETPFPKHVNV